MNRRTGHERPQEDERYDEGYRADAPSSIDDDDDWWLPNEADVTGPDAPFRYPPGEGPPDR